MARKAMTRQEWEALAGAAHYNAKELAKLRHLSVRQLERDFRRHLGRTPQDWLNEQRIKAAKKPLLAGELVKKVAYDLGFKQPSHFCRQFKLLHHLTPSEFADQV
jgi:AraC-like DNA-binding protein